MDSVCLLLQHGADAEAETKDMYTAADIAAQEGKEDVLAVLLERSPTKTLKNMPKRMTPPAGKLFVGLNPSKLVLN